MFLGLFANSFGAGGQGIRESGNQGVRGSGNQGVRESGNQGVRESGSQGGGHNRFSAPWGAEVFTAFLPLIDLMRKRIDGPVFYGINVYLSFKYFLHLYVIAYCMNVVILKTAN